jgi:hypothetical protein
MDIYWHDTMIVVSWQVLVVAGSLVLAGLIAAAFFLGWLLRSR